MKSGDTKNKKKTKYILIALGVIGLAAVMIFDAFYLQVRLLAEGWPTFTTEYIIRSVVIFASVSAIFAGLAHQKRVDNLFEDSEESSWEFSVIYGSLSLAVTFLILIIAYPEFFHSFSAEDGPIEWGSAILLLGSTLAFFTTWLNWRTSADVSSIAKWLLIILAMLFFVIAMEEISWFQRVLDVETPREFAGNPRNEMNFHNFVTDQSENLYYGGAFLFLVVFSFLRFFYVSAESNPVFRIFMARPFVGIVGTIAFAYNFDMWNIIFTQIAFFGSLVILIAFFVTGNGMKEKRIILFSMILVTVSQVVFLNSGAKFGTIWQVTEYKEFLIPLAFLTYSLDVSGIDIGKYYREQGS